MAPSDDSAESGKVKYIKADLFKAPPNSILVHACNTKGSWGGGIAVAFKERYPSAFQVYKAHCDAHGTNLIGTCLLIRNDSSWSAEEQERGHHIACLFTSRAYGKRKDKPEEILSHTKMAVIDLMKQNIDGKVLHSWYVQQRLILQKLILTISYVISRINSGKFAVPWAQTEEVLEELCVEMIVYDPIEPVG
jgi:ADP-ribose 1''-phosphate phosphatase